MRAFECMRKNCSHGPVGRLTAGRAELDRPQAKATTFIREGGEDDVKDNPSSPRFHPNRVEDNAIHPISIFLPFPCSRRAWLAFFHWQRTCNPILCRFSQ